MAKTEKNKADAPEYKRGEVTIMGVTFTDDWARKLKPGKYAMAAEADKDKEYTAEELFVLEFKDAHYKELEEGDRIKLLKEAYKACLDAK